MTNLWFIKPTKVKDRYALVFTNKYGELEIYTIDTYRRCKLAKLDMENINPFYLSSFPELSNGGDRWRFHFGG